MGNRSKLIKLSIPAKYKGVSYLVDRLYGAREYHCYYYMTTMGEHKVHDIQGYASPAAARIAAMKWIDGK